MANGVQSASLEMEMSVCAARTGLFSLLTLLAVTLLQSAMPGAAEACSMQITSMRVSANYYLVRETPLIMLARAPEKPGGGDTPSPSRLRRRAARSSSPAMIDMQVVTVLKGQFSKPTLTLTGTLRQGHGHFDESDFQQTRVATVNPDCSMSRSFRYGKLYLLFLEPVVQEASRSAWFFHPSSPAQWQIANQLFGRVEEEVSGPLSPWVVTVQHYLRIAAMANSAREVAAMKALRLAAVQSPSQEVPGGLIADVDMYLSDERSGLPTEEVVAIARAFLGERDLFLWELAVRADLVAGPYMLEILKAGPSEDQWQPILKYIRATKDQRLVAYLEQRFASLSPSTRWDVLAVLVSVYGVEERRRMLPLLEQSTTDEFSMVIRLFGNRPSPQPMKELTRYVRMSDDARPSIFELAAAGEPTLVTWAIAQLDKGAPMDARAVGVLALSPLDEARAQVCRRVAVDHAFLKETLRRYERESFKRWDRIACTAHVQALSAEDHALIKRWLKQGKEEHIPEALQLLSQPEWQERK